MDVTFPIQWSFGENPTDGIRGPAVDDAGTVYILRDEDEDEDWPDGNYEAPVLVNKTTLAEMVSYCLDGWRTRDGYTEDDHVAASDALAAALRAAADMLDAGKRPNAQVTSRRDLTKENDMTKAAHTPWPWEEWSKGGDFAITGISAANSYTAKSAISDFNDGFAIQIAASNGTAPAIVFGETKEEAIANARLIAAAPELLEALTAVVKSIERNDFLIPIPQARAAIVKATGE